MNDAMLFYGLLLLALLGAGPVVWLICRAVRWAVLTGANRWFWPRARVRLQRTGDALNKTWSGKMVRHAPSGQVGMCLHLCLKVEGWRDALFPRWKMMVAVSPRLAAALARPVRDEDAEAEAAFGPVFVLLPEGQGLREHFPLEEMTAAPSGDAAEFRARMMGEERL